MLWWTCKAHSKYLNGWEVSKLHKVKILYWNCIEIVLILYWYWNWILYWYWVLSIWVIEYCIDTEIVLILYWNSHEFSGAIHNLIFRWLGIKSFWVVKKRIRKFFKLNFNEFNHFKQFLHNKHYFCLKIIKFNTMFHSIMWWINRKRVCMWFFELNWQKMKIIMLHSWNYSRNSYKFILWNPKEYEQFEFLFLYTLNF